MQPAKSATGDPSLSRALGKLLAPALLLFLAYGFIIVRPLSQQASEYRSNIVALEKAVAELEMRRGHLNDDLTSSALSSAQQANVATSAAPGRVVAHHSESPAKLSSRLLEYVTRNQLECLQVTSFDAPDTERPQADLRLELIGPFERFKAMLTQVAGELEGVVVSGLTMSRQDGGNCRWQLDVQFGGGVL